MSWIAPAALARARGHVGQIAARLAGAGLRSSTVAQLQADLDVIFEVNPKTGYFIIPNDHVTQLQSRAAELESVLWANNALPLGDHDLAQLRYLLSEEIVG
jgi:hypothetical protein